MYSPDTVQMDVLTSYGSHTDAEIEKAAVVLAAKGLFNRTDVSNDSITVDSKVFDHNAVSSLLIDTHAAASFPAVLDEDYVIRTKHNNNPTISGLETAALAGSSGLEFKVLSSTSALHDTNVKVSLSHLQSLYDTSIRADNDTEPSYNLKAEFDQTDANHHHQRAVNSEFNTKLAPYIGLSDVGTQSVSVVPDNVFNSTKAGGRAGFVGNSYTAKYAEPNQTDSLQGAGDITFTDITNHYQPSANSWNVELASNEEQTYEHGSFKIDNAPSTVAITAVAGTFPTYGNNVLPNLANLGVGSHNNGVNTSLPASMTLDDFKSLFSDDVLNSLKTGYKVSLGINSITNSGYKINDLTLFEQIDQSDLKDSLPYMRDLARNPHSINVTPGSVSMIAVDGNSSDATLSSLSINVNAGEKLDSSSAGVDGALKIDSRTPATRVANLTHSNLFSSALTVWYNGDSTNVNNYPVIDSQVELAENVSVRVEKIVHNTENLPTQEVLMNNGISALSYNVTNGPVNNLVNSSLVSFNASGLNTLAADEKVRVFEIGSQRVLTAVGKSLYADWDTTTNLPAGSSLSNMTVHGVMDNLVNDNTDYVHLRCKLTAKLLLDLSVNTYLPSNWTLNLQQGTTNLISSSVSAFNTISGLPLYNNAIMNNLPIYYRIKYETTTSTNSASSLLDMVTVEYSLNSNYTNATSFQIPQSNIDRSSISSTPDLITDVNPDTWEFVTGSYLSKEHKKLVQVVQSSTYSADFALPFGVYKNLIATVSDITDSRTFYAVQNLENGELLPSSSLLDVNAPSILYLLTVSESISTNSGSLTLEGIMNADDLKPYNAVIEGLSSSSPSWLAISDVISVDLFFRSENLFELIGTNLETDLQSDADVKLRIEPQQVGIPNIEISQSYLYIPFKPSPIDSIFSLRVLERTAAGLTDVLLNAQQNVTHLSGSNSFAAIGANWSSHSYTLSVEPQSNNTVISVKQGATTLFTITEANNMVFLGKRFVSASLYDIWASKRTINIGKDTAFFASNLSNVVSGEMILPNMSGVRVTNIVNKSTSPLGSFIAGELSPDTFAVNMIGDLSLLSSLLPLNNTNRVQQYVSSGLFSCILTLPKIRGYNQTNGDINSTLVQSYTLRRTGTQVSFTIGNSLFSQLLTSNLRKAMVNTVNALTDLLSRSNIDLGIKFTSNYSIPPSNCVLNLPVNVTGDSWTLEIENPNQSSISSITVPAGSSAVSNQKTMSLSGSLKDYGQDTVFTFSGSNALSSGAPLAFRSNRVKLTTSLFQHNNAKYEFVYSEGNTLVYKAAPSNLDAQDDLGNPMIYGGSWNLVETLVPVGSVGTNVEQGVVIGLLKVKQDPTKIRVSGSTSYLQIHAPRIVFECMSTKKDAINLLAVPYDYSALTSNDYKVKRILRYKSSKEYNPFASVVSNIDINGVNKSLAFNAVVSSGVNNIKFTYNEQPSLKDLLTTTTAVTRRVKVPGVVLRIERNYGRNPSVLQNTVLFEGPVTSISEVPDVVSRLVYCTRSVSNELYINIAQDPTVNGFPSGLAGFEEALQTTDKAKHYNINLKMDNPLWFSPSVNQIVFDINGNGFVHTLYSSHHVFDRASNENKIRVYKYESETDIDTHDVSVSGKLSKQTLSINFLTGRKYVDLLVPAFSFSDNANDISNYETLRRSIALPSVISWNNDTNFTEALKYHVAFGNSVTSAKLGSYFTVPDDAHRLIVHNMPDQVCVRNQFGLPTFRVSWLGVVKTPGLHTNRVDLSKGITSQQATIGNNNNNISLFSLAGAVSDI
jgi:hypothetical protein